MKYWLEISICAAVGICIVAAAWSGITQYHCDRYELYTPEARQEMRLDYETCEKWRV